MAKRHKNVLREKGGPRNARSAHNRDVRQAKRALRGKSPEEIKASDDLSDLATRAAVKPGNKTGRRDQPFKNRREKEKFRYEHGIEEGKPTPRDIKPQAHSTKKVVQPKSPKQPKGGYSSGIPGLDVIEHLLANGWSYAALQGREAAKKPAKGLIKEATTTLRRRGFDAPPVSAFSQTGRSLNLQKAFGDAHNDVRTVSVPWKDHIKRQQMKGIEGATGLAFTGGDNGSADLDRIDNTAGMAVTPEGVGEDDDDFDWDDGDDEAFDITKAGLDHLDHM